MKKLILTCYFFLAVITFTKAQEWPYNALHNGNLGNLFGTSNNFPVRIFTNSNNTAQFSTSNGLSGLTNTGDGLRILNPTPGITGGLGQIDIFTSVSNHTEIRFGGSGNIRGANLRFEEWGHYNGFFFNTSLDGGIGVYKFARAGAVTGFIGTNNFWRIGMQQDGQNFNGARRLEVLDNTQQFRLTFAGPNTATGPSTDFLSNNLGNLQIQPQGGKVGVNVPTGTNPSHNLEVNGNARIRNTPIGTPNCILVGTNQTGVSDNQISRLDFSGNPNEVLLGNGTWGTLPSPTPPGLTIFANNGITKTGNTIQLGEPYNVPKTVPLLNDREIYLEDYDLIFTGKGRIGIGQTFPDVPSEKFDVVGNGRFRTLPSSINQANSSVTKVVMVDANGVLKWKDLSTFGFSGNAINGAWVNGSNEIEWGTNPLIHDTEIPMAGKNVAFTSLPGSTSNTNNIKIGGNNTPIPVKLSVLNDVENVGILVNSNSPVFGGTNRYGLFGASENSYITTGVAGSGSNGVRTVGVLGRALNGVQSTTGVSGIGTSTLGDGVIFGGNFTANSNTIFENIGVNGHAFGSPKTNIGGYFTSQGGTLAIGVYGEANSSDPGASVYAGYFAGTVISPGNSIPSDIQFKTNVNQIQDATSILNGLNPVTYNYLQTGNATYMHFPTNLQYGLIAQEVETVLPDIISTVSHPEQHDSLGNISVPTFDFKTVKYELLIPVLIKGHQEQNAKIDSLMNINYSVTNNNDSLVQIVSDLNARLTLLENCLSNILPALCNANQMAVQQTPEEAQRQLRAAINVNLSDRNAIVLNQNVPNPFAESTIITFTIPGTVQKAQIHFYDGTGKLINSVDVIERGNGQLNVFANDLSTGVYTYSLVADGQIVSTKRMMKQ